MSTLERRPVVAIGTSIERVEPQHRVRYEFLTPRGRAWAAHVWFEKQADGSWQAGRATMGHLWRIPGTTLEAPGGASN
jgi:hypothetical protein